jgi:IMP cyclohydrolase
MLSIGAEKAGGTMSRAIKNLVAMEYPGRIIIIGKSLAGKTVVVYAITGRSPASQARKLEWREDGVWVRPTDEETLKKGSVDLLVYPAMLYHPGGVAVSNGKQTADIRRALERATNPLSVLSASLAAWKYEPDAPIFTPRISGCVLPGPKAALNLIKRGTGDAAVRNSFEIMFLPGKGKIISTYDGVNRDPLRSFPGEPLDADIEGADSAQTAEAVYESLKPPGGGPDFRVAVACLYAGDIARNQYVFSIINRCERT